MVSGSRVSGAGLNGAGVEISRFKLQRWTSRDGLRPLSVWYLGIGAQARKVDMRLPVKGNSNSHGARPVHLISTMLKWIRTSRLSIKNPLYR